MWIVSQGSFNLMNIVSQERLFIEELGPFLGDGADTYFFSLIYEDRKRDKRIVLINGKTEERCVAGFNGIVAELSEIEKVIDLNQVELCN